VLLLALSACLYLAHVGVSQERVDPIDEFTAMHNRHDAQPPQAFANRELARRRLETSRAATRRDIARLDDGSSAPHELSTLSESRLHEARRLRPADSGTQPQENAGTAQKAAAAARAPSAFELQLRDYVDPLVGQPVEQFGYDVFHSQPTESVDLAVGDDYVLGTGDNIVISMWGNVVDEDFTVTIDREGQVRLPDVGLIALKGLRIGEAEKLLKNKFGKIYLNFELQLRLGRVRDMYVHVVGRVANPGRLKVTSIATLFDVLAAAGGVRKDGSLRNILLRRQGAEPKTIDLYAYLLDGDLSVDLSLSPGDAVVVPAVGPRTAIVGRVLRPAIYEIKGDDNKFERLLVMAGGYGRLADRQSVQIESSSAGVLAVETVDLEQVTAGDVQLDDGDVIVVRQSLPKIENVVYVIGNVSRPGRYALSDSMRVSDVLTGDALVSAGFWLSRLPPSGEVLEGERVFEKLVVQGARPTGERESLVRQRQFDSDKPKVERKDPVSEYPEPFLEYALIRRIDPETRQEQRLAFHLGKAIFDRDPTEDIVLQSQDTIVVFPRSAYTTRRSVHVSGAVNLPGDYRHFEGMRLLDLLRMSGDLLPEAHRSSAFLTRIHPDQKGTRFETIEVDLTGVSEGAPEANILLQPDDALAVRVVPDYKKTLRVTIEGEVRQPGVYTVIPGERLSSLIARAGGYTEDAYLTAAQFYRKSVRDMQQRRLEESLQRLETEAELAAQRYTEDTRALGNEAEVAKEQARIGRTISTIRATPVQGRMVIELVEESKFAGTTSDVALNDGDMLRIPRRPEEVHVVGAVYNQTSLLHKDGLVMRDYLREVGGATESGDTTVAYIIRADGTADSARDVRSGYHWDKKRGRYTRGSLLFSKVHPGDTIVVPHDIKPQLSDLGLTKTITTILFQAAMATGVVVALL